MQVYKAFMKIAKTRLSSVILYIIIFLGIVLLLSFTAESENNSKFAASSVRICIIDRDESSASRALYDYLVSMHEPVTFDSYDNETLQDNLYYQNISYVLTIPEGFEDALLAQSPDTLVRTSKRQDSASGYFVDQQIDNYIRTLSLYIAGGFSLEEAIASTNETFAASPEVTSVLFEQKSSGKGSQMYYFYQYFAYVFIMIMIEGLSPILITFRQKDLGNRINCSALRQNSKNTQIGLGCATYSLGIWLIFIAASAVIYGPAQIFSANGLLCLLNSLVFCCITAAITLLIGSFQLKDTVLNMAANIIGLGMSFLCGIFVPQYYLGENVLMFSRFLPAYWYVRVTNMLSGFSSEALSMNTYFMCLGVQLLFFVAIFSVYLAVNRQQKRNSLD